jgi:hypothetical protein
LFNVRGEAGVKSRLVEGNVWHVATATAAIKLLFRPLQFVRAHERSNVWNARPVIERVPGLRPKLIEHAHLRIALSGRA